MTDSSGKEPRHEGDTARTSKRIAFLLIGMFGGVLGGVLGVAGLVAIVIALAAVFRNQALPDNPWFELFKSGFFILGGSLTTIIGYYFGSRGVQEAEANAKLAR